MKPRALFLVPSDYEELKEKGVAGLITERDEHGFFERVVTVHPVTGQNRVLDLSAVHRLYEFREYFLPGCHRNKVLRYPHHVLHVLRLVYRLARLIRQERIDLIRATDPAFTGFLAYLTTRLVRRPFCISIHADYDKRHELDPAEGSPTFIGSRRVGRALERFTLRRANLVLPIRESLAEKLRAWGIPAERIRVIPHGIDLEPFIALAFASIRPVFDFPPDRLIVSFAGRLSRENYVHDILDLAQELQKRRSDFMIVLAGDGPEKASLERQIMTQGLDRTVRLIGAQPRERVIALRRESAVALCLMGGYSLIEACAAGRPVIAYDVEWHSELVKTGETGALLREHDVRALTEAVSHLLDHPKEAERMGEKARGLAFERHDERKTSALKIQCYQEMLKR